MKENKLMDTITLIEPTIEYEKDIWLFRQELLDADDKDSFAGCSGLETCQTAKEWIDDITLRKSEETCPEGRVPSHVYLAVRKSDHKIVGIIDLRHHIDHPILGTWGGHIGYTVRPDERRKGYAKEMLRQNLNHCKKLGIGDVMVTCHKDNLASEKTILACGGVFEKNIEVDGSIVKRYWITAL